MASTFHYFEIVQYPDKQTVLIYTIIVPSTALTNILENFGLAHAWVDVAHDDDDDVLHVTCGNIRACSVNSKSPSTCSADVNRYLVSCMIH